MKNSRIFLIRRNESVPMLLIDYTTKEISDVLNISEKSINNIRSKIRKKMDVPRTFLSRNS